MSDYWKKKLDELNKNNAKTTTQPSSSNDYWKKKLSELEAAEKKTDEDIAPVRSSGGIKTTQVGRYTLGGGNETEVAKTILGDGEKTSALEHLGLMVTKGLSDFNRSVTSTLALVEKPVQAVFPGVATPLGDLADHYAEANDYYTEQLEKSKASRSVAGRILTDVGSGSVAALPQAVLALMTSGASLATQGATLSTTAGTGLSASLGTAVKSLSKNPLYWSSVAQTLGTDYEEAKKNGASETEAVATAVISSAFNAGIEVGGGTEVLPDRLKKGGASAVFDWVKSALEEGREEVVQGVISGITEKAVYDQDKELFSKEDEEAVINPGRMAKEFGMGAAVGGVLGGGQIATQGVANAVQTHEANKLTESEQKVVDHEFKNRVAKEEQNGKKLTNREKAKIHDAVISDMEKGGISTDTIEAVLGGETYQTYQNTVKNEDSLRETFNQLNQMKQGEMTGEQIDLRNELKEQLKELESKGERNQLKSQLGSEVMSLVQGDRLIESYNERFRKGQAFEADLTKYNEKQRAIVQKAIDSGILNNTNRTHEFVDMIAKISADKGVPFDFTNNQKLKDSGFAVDGKTVNGYVTKDGVTLNIQSAKALNSVVGHEITHVLEGTELYTALQSAVMEYAKTKGDYQGRYDSIAKLYEGIEGANVDAELTADLVGDYLFTDSDFINNLSTNHRNVFQKIYDEVKYLYKVATTGSKEAKELEKVKRAFENAYKATKNAADISGVKYALESKTQPGRLDPRTVTKSDVLGLLNQVEDGTIYGNTYIPVRIGTPEKLIYWAKARRGEVIDNRPIAISAEKAYNAMNREGETGTGRENALSTDEMVSMVEAMSDPQYIVYQGANDRYVEVVQFSTKKGDKAFAVIEIGNNKDSVYMNGYEGGLYNILVTTYPPKSGKLKELLTNSSNQVIYDKNKDASQRTSGSTVPSVLNDASFFDEIVPDNGENVNHKNSLSDGEAPVYGNYNVFGKDIALEQETVAENATVEEAAPVVSAETTMFPDNYAPTEEEEATYQDDRLASLGDADIPPEMEAPYTETDDVTVDDPFEDRDWYEVSNRKVNAYMYENPEVKPIFQEEAAVMLDELKSTTKGEKWYDDHLFYESGGEAGWGGTKRHTSDSIATMRDEWNMSYADIEKGLRAIIEDHGAENIAAAKKIEFMLNERLLDGYKSFVGYEPNMDKFGRVPQNQDYINMLAESQIVDAYSKESFDALMADADRYAPPISEEIVEDIAPVKETPKPKGNIAYEAIRPKKEKQPRLARATPEEQATASVLTEEPKVDKKKSSAWSLIKNNILDKGMIFEDLSLATGNRELQARWNTIRYADGKAQRFMEKNLKPIIDTVEKSGKTAKFYEYLYHMHNADRMSLADRYDDVPNKPVFGDGVTAEMSRDAATRLEKTNPEFKQWAQEVYNYNRQTRELLVEGGVISREVANLWEEMYPHYVPIRRVGDEGLNINVPLDTGRTGVNAPIKRATGGNRDILPLFDTMGQRTMQTYKAVAKNRFGVELKNTLGTTVENEAFLLDEVIDGIDAHEELLQEGKNGKKPTFTVFENGEKVTFEITDEMYDAMKPKNKAFNKFNESRAGKVLSGANNLRRGLLTEYNPAFMFTNPIKDAQDVLMNSQHPAKTYANFPKAFMELWGKKGRWYQEYMDNGGEQNTYFESDTNTFAKDKSAFKKAVGYLPDKISDANNFIERVPRMAEYIASRKEGRSIDVSMLDAARVTTNFAAGGDLTKFLNRNGTTFLNASVQGAMQQVRNVREAKANGLKGALTLAAKLAAAGLPAIMLNHLLWDDDEEYAELSDYVKQNYYIVGKYGDGKFVRIPKGRALAVIQNGFEQMENLITGNDEVDIATFGELLISNIAPNNPLDNNILAPIAQAWSNRTWYGENLVPTRLQDLPVAEQYDETTDEISKWLGEKMNVSPYKLNYLLDQYSGGIGDTFLPMITPEAERGDNTLLAPVLDKFTTDGVLKNQNVSDFYTKKDELTMNAKMSNATDEDILMSKYMNSVNSELSELYKQKREIQNSDLPDDEKYEAVRDIQKEIVALTKYGLDTYSDVSVYDEYANVGDRHYRRNKDGEWQKLTDDQLEKQEEVTRGLGIDASEYWSNKEEYDFAYEKPEKYAVAKSVGGYTAYRDYSSQLYDIKGVDNDGDGRSDTGTRKAKVLEWINNLDADYGTRLILFKSEYPSYDDANYDIIEYLNGRDDISFEEEMTILKELGFEVDSEGNISWD